MKYIMDLDDYSDQYNCLPWLLKMKELLPNLKVTLFTIPNKISDELLEQTLQYKWIQLAIHGFDHISNYECAKMSGEDFAAKVEKIKHMEAYVRGFKAPGWQINQNIMQVLKDWGWWLAVQYSDGRMNGDINGPYQPKVIPDLKFYAINELYGYYKAIHGHTWECCGNGPEDLQQRLVNMPKETEFVFINDYLKTK